MKPFQLIFTYAKKYKSSLTITAISMLLLVGAQLLLPWIVKLLVAAVTAPLLRWSQIRLRGCSVNATSL